MRIKKTTATGRPSLDKSNHPSINSPLHITRDGDTFAKYMSIESATGTYGRVDGIQTGIISNSGVVEKNTWKDVFGNDHVIDFAANVVGINRERLKEILFKKHLELIF